MRGQSRDSGEREPNRGEEKKKEEETLVNEDFFRP
jgi:hypothetical protein